MKRRDSLVALAALAARAPGFAQGEPARVAAASDLQFALPEVAAAFHQAGTQRVELNFGSSGNFARQIQQGAPFDLFLSADEGFVHRLADAGLTRDRGNLYAIGRIVLMAPRSSALKLDAELDGLRRDWDRVRRFAIANPEHAPYGRAAREALEKRGMWAQVQERLVLGENISQATQYIATGAADAGITALSLALAPPVAAQTRHVPLPESLHAPLRQRMVLLKGARPAALAFHEFLSSPEARAMLSRHGFAAPAA
ncbi:MAG TPA: molybdate ABC transporter substrate-binding protein [Albitalea sp.]|uniref:molybdate ABC transporter substrate-binding protein n=1 Tax=Piscinibacter sp. TaxID=1903157 RepID=UPI002ED46FB1